MFHFLGQRMSYARSAAVAMATTLGGLVLTANAAPHNAANSTELQNLLDNPAVVLGDTIYLTGTNYPAPSNGFILRAKSGTGYLTIQPQSMTGLPPAGQRIDPDLHAALMPNIMSPGGDKPAISTELPPQVAHHYKLIGLEIYNGPNAQATTGNELNNLIMLGTSSSAQNSTSVIAHNIIIDRCYIHGEGMTPSGTGQAQIRRGIGLHSNHTDIINCYISDILSNQGQTQGIAGWNGGGPYLIDNNFISTSGENVFFGGAVSYVVGQTPTGITVSRNHLYKDPAWKNVWTRPCNHFELKCGKDVIVRDNVMSYSWNNPADQQFGASIGLKCVQGSGSAGSSWYVTENILVENNRIHDVGLGFYIAGSKTPTGTKLYGQPHTITIRNNLVYNVSDAWSGDKGWLFYMNTGSPDITIDHNTAFQSDMSMMAGDSDIRTHQYQNFVYTNNMTMRSQFGFSASGSSDGELTLNDYFISPTYQKNVTMGSSTSQWDNWVYINNVLTQVGPPWYAGWDQSPFNNHALHRPSSWSGVLQDQANPGTDFSGWKVEGWDQSTNFATYPYNNAGTDGKDIGCDIDELNEATAGCLTGIWGSGGGSNLIASEDVNYTGNLNGQTGGTGFGSNAWTSAGGTYNNPVLTTGSLTHTDGTRTLVTSGNKIAPNSNSRSYRNFASVIPTASTTKWVSFRANYTGGGAPPSNHAGFSLFSGTAMGGTEIFFGKPGGSSNWGVDHSSTVRATTNTFQPDAFLVYKLAFTSSDVTISMWVNPSLQGESSLGTSHFTPLTKAHSSGFASLRFSTGTNASGYQFDEFRIGDSFADVAPFNAQPTTVTLKNGVNGYSGTTSFHVRGAAATTHYGSSRYYHETNNLAGTNSNVLRPFYKFDVSTSASGIPSNSTITSATFRVKVEFRSVSTDPGISVYRVAPHNGAFTVNYASATRNTYNGTNAWSGGSNAGGEISDSNNDYLDTPVDNNSTIPAVGQWIDFDVTSAVQAWVNGTANNGLLVVPNAGSSTTLRLSTPADSHGSGEYPELEVTYQ